MSTFMEMRDGQPYVTNDPAEVERLLNERTGTTPEQRRQMRERLSREEDERFAYDKGVQRGFTNGLYLGFALGGLFVTLIVYLFGSPINGVLL